MSSLTVASWPAYRFLMRQVSGLVFPSLEGFPTVYCDPHSQRLWHRQQSRSRCFLELSCFFDDPLDVSNLISGSSAFSKSSLNIWKFMVHILLKPGLENFEPPGEPIEWILKNKTKTKNSIQKKSREGRKGSRDGWDQRTNRKEPSGSFIDNFVRLDKKYDSTICCLQETCFKYKDICGLKEKQCKNVYHANIDQKKSAVAIFI